MYECKFSKHSPDSTITDTASVSFLMRKWSNTEVEVDGQNGNNFIQAQAPIVDEVRGETLR